MNRIQFYENYRLFLKDFYNEKKKRSPFFSYRYFNKKAGINSPSLYREVVSGKRNLTGKTIDAFIKGLGLTDTDGDYFRLLVQFNQALTTEEKTMYLEKMRGLKKKVNQKIIPVDHHEYYEKWYHQAIRELACIMDWEGDYSKLARSLNPPIKPKEASRSIAMLLRLGFLRKRDDGRYEQTDPALSSGSEIQSAGVRLHNKTMAELSVDAFDAYPTSERDLRSTTIGISENTYRLIKQEILEFRDRVINLVDKDNASDRVYNLNIHLFPLSKRSKK